MWRSIFARWVGRFGGGAAPRTWKDDARERVLVPVMDINWETLYAIDPEGRVVRSSYVDWRDVREETDPRARHIVLAQAALRDPEMVHLRPIRKPGDWDCAACGGTGTLAGSRMICDCGGLGWLPAEVSRENATVSMHIHFRRLRADDLPLLHRWLREPHVRRWYAPEPATYEQTVAKYGPRTADDHPVRSYLIVLDEHPVGYVQAYAADELSQPGETAVGVDLFIGEAAHVHRGLGAEVLRRFVDEVVFGRMGAGACIADPHPENHASIRAFEKAGFHRWESARKPGPEPALLLRRLRDAERSPET